jgi:hypothetical protein
VSSHKRAFVDTVRDLAGADLWRESLERSLERRRSSMPSSNQSERAEEPGEPPRGRKRSGQPAVRRLALEHLTLTQPIGLVAVAAGILVLAILAAVLPSASDGRGEESIAPTRSARHAHSVPGATGRPTAAAARSAAGAPLAVPGHGPKSSAALVSGGAAGGGAVATCQPVDRSSVYVNPLAHTVVTPKRIDQGVDYKGTGTLTALGPATITEIMLSETGWPGAFIEYQLTAGPAAGCYVFYAEGVTPAPGLEVGQAVRAGEAIATLIPDDPSGIEIGWGAGIGTETYAAQLGQWSHRNDEESIPTGAGRSFSALIAALGGPPGKVGG